MTVRFLADEDLDADIVGGLLARESAIDIVDVKTAGWRGASDRTRLYIYLSGDRSTPEVLAGVLLHRVHIQ